MRKVHVGCLKIGTMVKIINGGLPYKVVGVSEGGGVIFLIRSSFMDRAYSGYAVQVDVGDINAVLP